MIIGRQTQLHKLHTRIHLCVCVCVWLAIRVCLCVQQLLWICFVRCVHVNALAAAVCVESGEKRCDFSCRSLSLFCRAVILSFSHSVLLPPTPLAPVVSTILHTLLIPHVFFFSFLPHLLFVQLNLCIHFSLIVLPFRFLLLLLRSGIYFPLKSVTATLENNVDSIFPHNRSFGCSRGGCKVRAWGPSSADAWPNLYNGLHR